MVAEETSGGIPSAFLQDKKSKSKRTKQALRGFYDKVAKQLRNVVRVMKKKPRL